MFSVGFLHNKNAQTRDVYLEKGERIIGVVSRIHERHAERAVHRDF